MAYILGSNCENLRDIIASSVANVFGSTDEFFDFLEDEKYSTKYDCFINSSDENYIINTDTGEYINWYKLYHIGRSASISTQSDISNDDNIKDWVEKFLLDFKNSEE